MNITVDIKNKDGETTMDVLGVSMEEMVKLILRTIGSREEGLVESLMGEASTENFGNMIFELALQYMVSFMNNVKEEII